MLLVLLSLLVGLVFLVVGAELLVRGGGQLALALRIPALVVGLTIVAFGTSAPELMVSVTAAMNASTEMALANVNGSNLANIALVLGLAAVVAPLTVERTLLWREIPTVLLLQALVPAMCLDGQIARWEGIVLLLGGVAYNAWLMYEAMRGRAPAPDDDLDPEDDNVLKHTGLLVLGLLVLVGSAQLFVYGAVGVAGALGFSDRFIGLTVVALGTSAPEMATGMVSSYRGEVDLAVGNSLGSNLLNIAMVLGITSLIHPIETTDPAAFTDMYVAFGVTVLLVPFVLKGSITRVEGGVMAGGYVAYLFAGYYFGG